MIEASGHSPAYSKLIYLASPYSGSEKEIEFRVSAVQDATARLIEQGHLVFSPIVHSHPIKDMVSFEALNGSGALTGWMEYDYRMIDKCDELWILRLPGHTRSKGVHAELYHALDQGKKVTYINYPDLSVFSEVEAVEVAPNGLPDPWERELTKEDYGKTYAWGERSFPDGPRVQGDYNSEVEDVFGPPAEESDDVRAMMCDPGDHCIANYTCSKHRTTRTIIGLTGHAQSGKDTAGKYLIENHGFIRIALADPVRSGLYALNPFVKVESQAMMQRLFTSDRWNLAESETTSGFRYYRLQDVVNCIGWDEAKTIPEVRALLQKYGTDAGRGIHGDNCWLNVADRIINSLPPDAKVVITDIRFPNEAEWVRSHGGQVVRINREGFGPVNGHASDQRLEDALVDVEVCNDGDIAYLQYELVEKVLAYV